MLNRTASIRERREIQVLRWSMLISPEIAQSIMVRQRIGSSK